MKVTYDLTNSDKNQLIDLLFETIVPAIVDDIGPDHNTLTEAQENVWPSPIEVAACDFLIDQLDEIRAMAKGRMERLAEEGLAGS